MASKIEVPTEDPVEVQVIAYAVSRIVQQYVKNLNKWGKPPHGQTLGSGHEAYAVLLEELEELWTEIKQQGSAERLREEATDIGAVCIALIAEAGLLTESSDDGESATAP